jgi:hypothetical protein
MQKKAVSTFTAKERVRFLKVQYPLETQSKMIYSNLTSKAVVTMAAKMAEIKNRK